MKKLLLLLFISLSFIGHSNAGEYSYECTIENLYHLKNNGELEKKSQITQDFYQGNKFYVNRRNGQITGMTLPTGLAKEIRVINRGSSTQEFKTIAVFENFSEDEWQVLSIDERVKGKIKPFIAFAATEITAGICE